MARDFADGFQGHGVQYPSFGAADHRALIVTLTLVVGQLLTRFQAIYFRDRRVFSLGRRLFLRWLLAINVFVAGNFRLRPPPE